MNVVKNLLCDSLSAMSPALQSESQRLVLLEAGCGVGNCIFPLLEDGLDVFVYACDFSPRAVEFVKVRHLSFKSPAVFYRISLLILNMVDNFSKICRLHSSSCTRLL